MRRIATIAAGTALAGMTACGTSEEEGTMGDNMGALMDPAGAEMTKEAPATFKARFETTKGSFVVEVERRLAPNGADRFFNLVRHGYYNGNKLFRVIPGFVVQWGMSGDPALNKVWHMARIPDDPVMTSNEPGTITFAMAGPNTRTTQLFINYKNNAGLDGQGFSPFGRVVEGMEVVESFNAEYGGTPAANQQNIGAKGDAFLEKNFPNLDAILTATIE